MASGLFRGITAARKQTFLTAASILAWVPALVFVTDNTFDVVWVRGVSMIPSFNSAPLLPSQAGSNSSFPPSQSSNANSSPVSRDAVLLSKVRPTSNLRRGDIVAYWTPHDPECMAVKRVVALHNDEVETRPPYPFRRQIVPAGYIWVEGDNPDGRFSRDSNDFGPLSKSMIAGKVVAKLWPRPQWLTAKDWEIQQQQWHTGTRNNRIRRNAVREDADALPQIFRP